MNDKGDCRTAPATPGLLNMQVCIYVSSVCIFPPVQNPPPRLILRPWAPESQSAVQGGPWRCTPPSRGGRWRGAAALWGGGSVGVGVVIMRGMGLFLTQLLPERQAMVIADMENVWACEQCSCKCFLAWVKSVQIFVFLFCRKNELYHNLAL